LKKIISYLLALLMLLSSMGVSALAAGDTDGLSSAIAAAKSKFPVPEEYKKFSYDVNEQGGDKVWQLSWNSESGGSISMSVDSSGRLRSYYRYANSDYRYDNNKIKAPSITKDQARSVAEAAIAKAVPEVSGHLTADSRNEYLSTYSSTYTFAYTRLENGVTLASNTVNVTVNYVTKEVTSLYVYWNYDLSFPAVKDVIDITEAKGILKNALKVELEYRIQNDTGSGAAQAVLVYNNQGGYKSVDPFTGKVYDQNYDWDNAKGGAGDMGSGTRDSAPAAENGNAAYTEEELEKISELEKLLTADDADKILRQNTLLALDDSFTLTSKSLSSVFKRTDAGNTYIWNLNYTGKVVKDRFSAPSAYASLDAKTGEILSFYRYDNEEPSGSASYNETTAGNTAKQFLSKNAPDKFASMVKEDENRIQYLNDDETKNPTSFGFSYVRQNGGVKLNADYMNVTVDASSGKITNFYSNWHGNITFQSKEGIIESSAAIDKMLEQCGFSLQYELFTTYLYDEESGGGGSSASKETIVTYPSSVIPSELSIRLVYMPDYFGRPLTVSARTGELVDYNGQPYEDNAQGISYSDAKGHWAENLAGLLAGIGIGFDGGSLSPDKNVTQKEFLYLLSKTIQVYLPFDSMSGLTNKSNLDDLYKQMESMGVIKAGEKNPDAAVTKMDAIRFAIRAAGYEKAATVEGIYKTPFKDDASIPASDKGYCALAYGLGVVKGDENGNLGSKSILSRAQSLSIIYNYMSI